MLARIPVQFRHAIKSALAPLIYRQPPTDLHPGRLYVWLDTLEQTRALPGPVVEIGCNLCGTSVIAYKMLSETGVKKRYICIDTFNGFVESHFRTDLSLGTPVQYRHAFSANSMALVRRILQQHGGDDIELIQADICKYEALPDGISACLLDVDLSLPTYEGLKKVYAKLAPGGLICVDDCPEGYDWKARDGYRRFTCEYGLPEIYRYGMGIVRSA